MIKKLLFALTVLCVSTTVALAADVSGKWTWEQAGRQGGNPTVVTLTLAADGGKLTGSMDSGRSGPVEISDGHVDGNSITFNVKRSFGGNDVVTPYKGIISNSGDTLKLEFTQRRGGGEPTPITVTAKRAAS